MNIVPVTLKSEHHYHSQPHMTIIYNPFKSSNSKSFVSKIEMKLERFNRLGLLCKSKSLFTQVSCFAAAKR